MKIVGSSTNRKMFVVTVIVPTFIAMVYFGLFASDIYVSESRFVVRSQQRQDSGNILSTFLQGTSFGRSQDDALIVTDYIESMDAVKELDRRLKLRSLFGKGTADFGSRFPRPGSDESDESLLQYYRSHIVSVIHDSTSSITTLRTSAFDARSAQRINENLLAMSEGLVNELNRRGLEDGVRYASEAVRAAQARVTDASLALARYRSAQSVFDPDRQSALALQQVGKLQDELIATRAKLAEVVAVSPMNPQIEPMKSRQAVLEHEIELASQSVTGKDAGSFTSKARTFERLNLEKEFSERELASALALQEQARSEAVKKQLYVARIVKPGLPDASVEPRRLRCILITLVIGLVTWGILSLLLAGVREHTQQ